MTTVLLVEDDPAARQGLELALSRLGYGVRAAATGEAALDGLGEGPVDVVVLDVMLPGLDGFEVCRRLRRDGDTPVIMLTARGDDFDIVGAWRPEPTITWSNRWSRGCSMRGSGQCCAGWPGLARQRKHMASW